MLKKLRSMLMNCHTSDVLHHLNQTEYSDHEVHKTKVN